MTTTAPRAPSTAASAAAVPTGTIRGIDHIGLTVPDIDTATDFFVRGFDAVVLYDRFLRSEPVRRTRDVQQRLGIPHTMAQGALRMLALPNGPGLELFEYHGRGQRGAARPSDLGWQHVAFYVDDLDAALARVESVGGRRYAEPRDLGGNESGCGNRFVYVGTPWGSTLELITYPTMQAGELAAPRPKWRV
ncbi:VOC family protein [Microbacterium sp. M1A1_1b]|uniref:VOC family protein n=1 Tax=Curtobacterium sp. VKM Ac-2922 TaxID=2929475 RepID=UPI001FB327B7|nr:VOC family protein [Curtobacterium sp. VKM Ac-2922]MCJ1714737.1 VOC family protein [Curtobacterium sp. VKM Ac-2922]